MARRVRRRLSRPIGEPELIVVAKPGAALRAGPSRLKSLAGANTSSLNKICEKYGASMRPLFGDSEERLLREAASVAAVAEVPNLASYYRVDAPGERLHQIMIELRKQQLVEAAYIKPPAEPAQFNDMSPMAEEPPAATPNFFGQQGYMGHAPGGIDVGQAWTQRGGRGADVRIIDIEGAWRFSHEDLTQNQGGVVGGTESSDLHWRNHGTAVVGVIGGDDNGFGVTGICPEANVSAISIFGGMGSAAAIRTAANRLQPGDIILIELHRPGPRNNFEDRDDQHGYIGIEWWPDDFDAIRFATRARQVVVVEAAGNGAQNLDDPIYGTPASGFPANWTNPFRRGDRDSDAILVGAGAPPPGTHGRDHGPDRSRLEFSNFGFAVDAQGWGREVTTCGYGDLQGGNNEDLWYTDRFSGTSSASPIVVGTLACLQGIRRAQGLLALSPRRARDLLRTTGSFQQDAPGRPSTQRIGSRPDLRVLVGVLNSEATKTFKDAKDKEGSKDSKEKEGKDSKEKEVKEVKDNTKEAGVKDFKDKDKEHKDGKDKDRPDLAKAPSELLAGSGIASEKNISDRLDGLERRVAQLTHFISSDLRPDLAMSTLAYDQPSQPDEQALSADLQRRAQSAKNAKETKDTKDTKDLEKLTDR